MLKLSLQVHEIDTNEMELDAFHSTKENKQKKKNQD